jgi:acetyl esterase
MTVKFLINNKKMKKVNNLKSVNWLQKKASSSIIKTFIIMATLTNNSENVQAQNPYEKLHPQAQYLLAEMAKQYANDPKSDVPPTPAQQLEAARMGYRHVNALAGKHEVFGVEEREVDGVKIRIYKPSNKPNLPVVLYLHGGGFVSGDFETHDGLIKNLTNLSQAIYVAVEYRRSPENPFPAAPNDALKILKFLAKNAQTFGGNPTKIGLMGDSAGGDLAAVVVLMNRDQKLNIPIAFQVLIYPDTDLTESSESWQKYGEFTPGIISKNNKDRNIAIYANGSDLKNPYLSPLYADLKNFPNSLVLTAEFDPQHDEGEQFAEKLNKANVKTQHKNYQGMMHGFFQMGGVLDTAKEAINDVSNFVKEQFMN